MVGLPLSPSGETLGLDGRLGLGRKLRPNPLRCWIGSGPKMSSRTFRAVMIGLWKAWEKVPPVF